MRNRVCDDGTGRNKNLSLAVSSLPSHVDISFYFCQITHLEGVQRCCFYSVVWEWKEGAHKYQECIKVTTPPLRGLGDRESKEESIFLHSHSSQWAGSQTCRRTYTHTHTHTHTHKSCRPKAWFGLAGLGRAWRAAHYVVPTFRNDPGSQADFLARKRIIIQMNQGLKFLAFIFPIFSQPFP